MLVRLWRVMKDVAGMIFLGLFCSEQTKHWPKLFGSLKKQGRWFRTYEKMQSARLFTMRKSTDVKKRHFTGI